MGLLRIINKILALPLVFLLYIYQKTVSPDYGLLIKWFFPNGYCKFYPTCSVYAVHTLKKHGIFGIFKVFKRVASCNPSSMGGIDFPYPEFNSNK